MQLVAISQLIEQTADKLAPVYPNRTLCLQYAWWTLQAITNRSQTELLAEQTITLTADQQKKLYQWLVQLVEHEEPIQYLIGSVPFGSLTMFTEHPILIPRPETEEWTLQLLEQIQKADSPKLSILDIATGSGCIGITLAHGLPSSYVIATDISTDAVALAKKNADFNKVTNISCVFSDLFQAIPADIKFDIIVANPPYISHEMFMTLSPSVTAWEDYNALVADEEGFAIIEHIIAQARQFLKPNLTLQQAGIAQLSIEIGFDQGERARACMQEYGYHAIEVKKDLEGKDRVICGSL